MDLNIYIYIYVGCFEFWKDMDELELDDTFRCELINDIIVKWRFSIRIDKLRITFSW